MIRATKFTILVVVALWGCSLANAETLTHYTFDDTLADTATGGATADDLTALNVTDTGNWAAPDVAPGTPVYVPGVVGKAAAVGLHAVAGRPNILSAVDSDDLDLAGDEWTIEMYIHPDFQNPDTNCDRMCVKWYGETNSNQYHWTLWPEAQDLFANGGAVTQGSKALPVGSWSHIAMTNDTTNGLQIWQNGEVIATAGHLAIAAGRDPLEFGNMLGFYRDFYQFTGLIDDFMIHDEAMGQAYMESRTSVIPEPSTMALLLLSGLMVLSRRFSGRP
jgi:hypothetical protein